LILTNQLSCPGEDGGVQVNMAADLAVSRFSWRVMGVDGSLVG
jgi:hypothetical protein